MTSQRDRDDITPVEVPFEHFEGPTDPRLKGTALDTRVSGTEQDTTAHNSESERPLVPIDASPEYLAREFKTLAHKFASREAFALDLQRKSNALLELVSAQLKTLPMQSSPPPGYWLLVGAVVVLTVLQVADLWFLRVIMQSLAR